MQQLELSPAELKTLREKWGLSSKWLAEQANVRVRTIQYWESGRSAVPEDVSALMMVVDMRLEDLIDRVVDHVMSLDPPPTDAVLVRYKTDEDLFHYRPDMKEFSARAHAMTVARVQAELQREGIETRIVYLVPEQYEAWLKLTQKKDSESTRAEWAGTICP